MPKTNKSARRARCERCDGLFPADEVLNSGGVKVCSECDETHYCEVCQERMWPDDYCRHIFDFEGDLYGCGAGEREYESHRRSFIAVLNKTGLSHEIRYGLTQGKIATRYGGSMLGPTHYKFEVHLGAKGKWGDIPSDFGDLFTDDLTYEEEVAMTVGVGWLDSLACDDRPQDAVDITLQWIDQWEALKRQHQELMWFHGTHSHIRRYRRTLADTAAGLKLVAGRRRLGPRAALSSCGRYVGSVDYYNGDTREITVFSRDHVHLWGDGEFPTGSYSPRSSYSCGGFEIGFSTPGQKFIRGIFNRPFRQLPDLPTSVPEYEGDFQAELPPEE